MSAITPNEIFFLSSIYISSNRNGDNRNSSKSAKKIKMQRIHHHDHGSQVRLVKIGKKE